MATLYGNLEQQEQQEELFQEQFLLQAAIARAETGATPTASNCNNSGRQDEQLLFRCIQVDETLQHLHNYLSQPMVESPRARWLFSASTEKDSWEKELFKYILHAPEADLKRKYGPRFIVADWPAIDLGSVTTEVLSYVLPRFVQSDTFTSYIPGQGVRFPVAPVNFFSADEQEQALEAFGK